MLVLRPVFDPSIRGQSVVNKTLQKHVSFATRVRSVVGPWSEKPFKTYKPELTPFGLININWMWGGVRRAGGVRGL